MSITAASAVIQLAISIIFPTPQQIQGFAEGDVFDAASIKVNEVQMGVDRRQSAGWVAVSKPITFHLLADSESNDIFDEWASQMEANRTVYPASGLILLDTGEKWTMNNGALTDYMWIPPAKRLLMPRAHTITFESVIKAVA
jgi:hypothetical protein